MINFNGTILSKDKFNLPYNNRAFSYGDSIFDTSKLIDGKIEFLEAHYFRLMASMRMLRMEIPMFFTLEYFEKEIFKITESLNLEKKARIKFTVFRNIGGLYTPNNNKIDFIVEATNLEIAVKEHYVVDLFKDYYVSSDLISTIKTNNRIVNVLASIYASENGLDNCLLLNEKKNVVEATNGNVFLIKGNEVHTPPLSEGCIKGIIRNKVIEKIQNNGMFRLVEKSISPFELLKADAMFITNSIIGIQSISNYRKKEFNTYMVDMVQENA
ncbi:MAG: aminotransferase class IV [Flavobacteriaceae bacterium]